LQLVSV